MVSKISCDQYYSYEIDLLAIADLDGLLHNHTIEETSVYSTISVWFRLVSIQRCRVPSSLIPRPGYEAKYHPDSIVFMDRLESIRYLQYWNVNAIEP